MRILIQRVKKASVTIDGELYSSINNGILLFLCIEKGDTSAGVQKMAQKVVNFRIFSDKNDKMNLSLLDVNGEMLVVSQFTLSSDCKKGTRPSFDKSATPDIAKSLYNEFIESVKSHKINTQHGKFGAMMDVELINDGPVTFMMEHNCSI